MTTTFKIGDVVVLKSGGPKMTITNKHDREGVPHVWCTWAKDGKNESAYYPPDAVMLATDREPPVVNRGPSCGTFAASRRGH